MIETLIGFDGKPRVWFDGSEVRVFLDERRLIDWNQTAEINPSIVKRCYDRGYNIEVELRRKIGEQCCHGCGVYPGEFHEPGCDVEACPICGEPIITCACNKGDEFYEEIQKLGGLIPWSGSFPRTKEAIEYDFWCKWSLLAPSERTGWATSGWIRCQRSDQGSKPDLHRVTEDCVWDKHQRRWVLRQTIPTETSEAR